MKNAFQGYSKSISELPFTDECVPIGKSISTECFGAFWAYSERWRYGIGMVLQYLVLFLQLKAPYGVTSLGGQSLAADRESGLVGGICG